MSSIDPSAFVVHEQVAIHRLTDAQPASVPLSIVDSTFAAFPATPLNYFFKTKISVGRLKEALSRLLDVYPHVAGRLVASPSGQLHIEQGGDNEPGVLFTSATWDAPISTVLPSTIAPGVSDAAPSSHPMLCTGEADHIAAVLPTPKAGHLVILQLTTFQDGCVLAVRALHCLMDAHTAITSVNGLAEIYRSTDLSSTIKANFNPARLLSLADSSSSPEAIAAAAKSLPWSVVPSAIEYAMLKSAVPPPPEPPQFGASTGQALFSLTPADIQRIHSACDSSVTPHDAIVALIWTCVIRARATPPEAPVTLGIAMGLRHRIGQPRLGDDFFGSPCFGAGLGMVARDVSTAVAAKNIRAVVKSFNDRTIPPILSVMACSPAPAYCLAVDFGASAPATTSWVSADLHGAVFTSRPVHVQAGFQGISGVAAVLRAPRLTAEGKLWYEEGAVVQLALESQDLERFIAEFDGMMDALE